jgi:Ca-activated chloride channel family protein
MMRWRSLAILALVTLSLWGCAENGREPQAARHTQGGGADFSLKGQPSPRDPDDVGVDLINRSNSPLPGVDVPAKPEPPPPARTLGPGELLNGQPSSQEVPKRKDRREDEELLIIQRKVQLQEPTLPPGDGWRESDLTRGCSLTTRVQDRFIPLPLEHTDVKAQLTFAIGSVTVTQQYHNPYGGKIEAVYVFPLPDDAAVRDFILQVGDRRIRGIIREREEATQIYLEARRQGHVASLMTQERPNIFTQRVANIEPGKRIDVSITYFHTLRYQEGEFTFVYPMVVGPRYNPAGFHDGVGAVPAGAYGASQQRTEAQYLRPDQIATNDIGLEVAIDAGAEIGDITSPTHAIRAARSAPGRALVTLSPNDRIPNRDFVLRYRVAGNRIGAGMVVNRDEAGGTFALMIHPPESLKDVPRTAREMIFVIDTSGSMSGRPVEVAKRALIKCLKRLEPDDSFQILEFSDHVTVFHRDPVPATVDNVQRGIAFTEALHAGGGTEMQEVVRMALDYPVAPGRRRIVSFMTDGFIGNDREVVAFARAHLGGARIFSFGVGDSVNRYLLEALGRVGRGVSTFITLDESTEIAADELYKRIEHPALTDLRIDWGGMNVLDVQPNPLPDLYLGKPVVLYGRFRGAAPAKVQITGRAGDRPFETAVAVDAEDAGARHAALPAVWARTKITGLHDALFASGDSREISGEIRSLSLRYGLLSEFTAFVAVDSLTRTAGEFGTTVVQPVPVPNGVQYSTTVEK